MALKLRWLNWTMKSPRVRIWKLTDAPRELQLLYNGPGTPAWVALIPRELNGTDLDDVMAGTTRAESISRYVLQNGDVVYIGTPSSSEILAGAVHAKPARASSR